MNDVRFVIELLQVFLVCWCLIVWFVVLFIFLGPLRPQGRSNGVVSQISKKQAMSDLSYYIVLNDHPPPISGNERQLPKKTKAILAQLKCCSHILSGKGCVRDSESECPLCHQVPYGTAHIYKSSAKSTTIRRRTS